MGMSDEMFSCRFCSESPFARLFGADPPPPGGTTTRQTRRSPSSFVRRNSEEMQRLIASWDHYVSSRAKDFFVTREKLEEVLMMIARGIHHTEDPILGVGTNTWTLATIPFQMVKPTEDTESLTYVNRVMVLIFSSDEAFQHLMTLPKAPFR
ncbi:conserved hypothetical protein [Perkinsus marinus ATCC 50983]|uniref:Uncharacterized protein n=1 Tax=Perkinsus marinus (strain ATCC 50983 / TXsc) TaxID=423536 RepID=C5KDC5_PERM5|nr:conserved hypothetical protein [Perkinsus marinus ATCC 50983]EER17558.1 conserved hypothetical protein [Perkinsus marinus ATCC 50983]|eukprot:XP_002785762.1 conserved hypothetical protein [Perkinsus marinus ATCC 50983]